MPPSVHQSRRSRYQRLNQATWLRSNSSEDRRREHGPRRDTWGTARHGTATAGKATTARRLITTGPGQAVRRLTPSFLPFPGCSVVSHPRLWQLYTPPLSGPKGGAVQSCGHDGQQVLSNVQVRTVPLLLHTAVCWNGRGRGWGGKGVGWGGEGRGRGYGVN